jgi:hypothetical protein
VQKSYFQSAILPSPQQPRPQMQQQLIRADPDPFLCGKVAAAANTAFSAAKIAARALAANSPVAERLRRDAEVAAAKVTTIKAEIAAKVAKCSTLYSGTTPNIITAYLCQQPITMEGISRLSPSGQGGTTPTNEGGNWPNASSMAQSLEPMTPAKHSIKQQPPEAKSSAATKSAAFVTDPSPQGSGGSPPSLGGRQRRAKKPTHPSTSASSAESLNLLQRPLTKLIKEFSFDHFLDGCTDCSAITLSTIYQIHSFGVPKDEAPFASRPLPSLLHAFVADWIVRVNIGHLANFSLIYEMRKPAKALISWQGYWHQHGLGPRQLFKRKAFYRLLLRLSDHCVQLHAAVADPTPQLCRFIPDARLRALPSEQAKFFVNLHVYIEEVINDMARRLNRAEPEQREVPTNEHERGRSTSKC